MARKRDNTKVEAIYKAALKIALDTGFTGLTMADVAEEAGIATGTVYTYFKSKEELINRLYLHLKEAKIKKMFRAYTADEPFYKGFRRVWNNYFHACLEQPERMIFIEQYYHSHYLSEETKRRADDLLKPLFVMLERGRQEQIIIDIPIQSIISQLMGAINEIVKFHIESQTPITKSLTEQYCTMGWNSIRK